MPTDAVEQPTLERVLGLSALHNAALCANPVSGEVAYPAGCVAVILDPATQEQARYFRATQAISCLAFSPDGRYLCVGERGSRPAVIVWDLGTGAVVLTLSAHKYGVGSAAFDRTGSRLATVGFKHDRQLILWDVARGAPIWSERVSQKVHRVLWTPSGEGIFTCGDRHAKFWNLNGQGTPASILEKQRGASFVDACAPPGGGRILCVTSEGTLVTFGEESKLVEQYLHLQSPKAYCVSAAGGILCAGCANGVIRAFAVDGLRHLATLAAPPPCRSYASSLTPVPSSSALASRPAAVCACLAAGRLLALYGDNTLSTFRLSAADAEPFSARQEACVPSHSGGVWDAAFLPRDVAADAPAAAHAVASAGRSPPAAQPSRPPGFRRGALVTLGADHTLRFSELDSDLAHVLAMPVAGADEAAVLSACGIVTDGELDAEIPGRTAPGRGPRCLAVRADGLQAAAGDADGDVKVFDVAKMRQASRMRAHDGEVLGLAYAPRGLVVGASGRPEDAESVLASAATDSFVHVFATGGASLRPLAGAPLHEGAVAGVDFDSSALRLFSAGSADRELRVTSLLAAPEASPQEVVLQPQRTMTAPADGGRVTAFCRDRSGVLCVTGGADKALRVWNVRSGRKRSFPQKSPVTKVCIDPSGLLLATAGADKWVRVLDLYSGRLYGRVRGHGDVVTAVAFSPDGDRLVTAGADGVAFVWRLPEALRGIVRDRLDELEQLAGPAAAVPPTPAALPAAELRLHDSRLPVWAASQRLAGEAGGGGLERAKGKGKWAADGDYKILMKITIDPDAAKEPLLPEERETAREGEEDYESDFEADGAAEEGAGAHEGPAGAASESGYDESFEDDEDGAEGDSLLGDGSGALRASAQGDARHLPSDEDASDAEDTEDDTEDEAAEGEEADFIHKLRASRDANLGRILSEARQRRSAAGPAAEEAGAPAESLSQSIRRLDVPPPVRSGGAAPPAPPVAQRVAEEASAQRSLQEERLLMKRREMRESRRESTEAALFNMQRDLKHLGILAATNGAGGQEAAAPPAEGAEDAPPPPPPPSSQHQQQQQQQQEEEQQQQEQQEQLKRPVGAQGDALTTATAATVEAAAAQGGRAKGAESAAQMAEAPPGEADEGAGGAVAAPAAADEHGSKAGAEAEAEALLESSAASMASPAPPEGSGGSDGGPAVAEAAAAPAATGGTIAPVAAGTREPATEQRGHGEGPRAGSASPTPAPEELPSMLVSESVDIGSGGPDGGGAALPQPVNVYHEALRDLQTAALRAVALYEEVAQSVDAGASSSDEFAAPLRSLRDLAPPALTGDGLLGSFQESFRALRCSLDVLETSTSAPGSEAGAGAFALGQSGLDASSLETIPEAEIGATRRSGRGSGAYGDEERNGGSGIGMGLGTETAASVTSSVDSENVDAILEKYSDLLLQRITSKLDASTQLRGEARAPSGEEERGGGGLGMGGARDF